MGFPMTLGRVALQAQGSGWGTEVTSFVNADFFEAAASLPVPTQESLEADVMRANWFAPTRLAGGKGPVDMQFTMPIRGLSTATPSANPAVHPEAIILASVLGTNAIDGYTPTAGPGLTGGNQTLVDFTAGSVSDADVGHAALVPHSGGHQWAWWNDYVSGATDTLGAQVTLENTPSVSGDVLGSNTVYLDKTQPTPFTVQFLGSDGRLAIRLWDGVCVSATLNFPSRGKATMNCTLRFSNWTNAGADGAGPAAAAMTDRPYLPAIIGSNNTRLARSAGELPCSNLTVSLTNDVETALNFSSSNGIGRFVSTKRTVRVEAMSPAAPTGVTANLLDDLTTGNLATPGTSHGSIQFDANTTPGRALSILIGDAQCVGLQDIGPDGAKVGIKTTWEPALYTSDVGSVVAPANTPFRIAFG